MAKRMSAGGKAALITGACLIGLAAVGTGLYFGVAAIREKVDDIAARTGTITLRNLWAKDYDNMTDDEKKQASYKDGSLTLGLAQGESSYIFAGDKSFDVKSGEIYFSSLSTTSNSYDEGGIDLLNVIPNDIRTIIFNYNSNSNWEGVTSGIALKDVKDAKVAIHVLGAVTFANLAVYNGSDLGYKSLEKANYVFSHLTQDMKTIKGDLTFKKADVLKYADAYEESIKAASSSAASTAASSSAA